VDNVLFSTDKEIALEFGQRLKNWRIANKVKQRTLAESCDIPLSAVRALEQTGKIQLHYLIPILRQYQLLQNFLDLVPLPELTPMQVHRQKQQSRPQRVRDAK
jgi:transcriptional regulator with XRE-family HTH domain